MSDSKENKDSSKSFFSKYFGWLDISWLWRDNPEAPPVEPPYYPPTEDFPLWGRGNKEEVEKTDKEEKTKE